MVTKRPAAKKAAPAKRRTPKKSASLDPRLTANLVAIGHGIPRSELANLPRDGSTRFDDYYIETLR